MKHKFFSVSGTHTSTAIVIIQMLEEQELIVGLPWLKALHPIFTVLHLLYFCLWLNKGTSLFNLPHLFTTIVGLQVPLYDVGHECVCNTRGYSHIFSYFIIISAHTCSRNQPVQKPSPRVGEIFLLVLSDH